ncbi:sugar ABC transporter substrate-binding protein [Petroclostridium xylanilyticum]|uniref:sugar ABC transporter substrate-binding protein n=1 Tax=Petroclostridium xylanilyticum TaxID=1792311 RepID=UPI000B993214|nr:sugar ABC transporter substrate-binding protein [Petroclostridium xylanilyticum]
MKNKKLLAGVLIFMLVLSLFAGCAQKQTAPNNSSSEQQPKKEEVKQEDKTQKKVRIGVSMSDFDDKWLSYMIDAMKAYSNTLADAEVIFVDAKADTAKQLAQLENFIAQKVDVVVINPVDTDATEPYTKMCKDAGIPLISVNRIFKNQEEATAYVGSDSIKAGIMQMEYLAEKMGGKGNIVILQGDLAHEAARMRTEGVKKVIKEKYPDIKIVAEQTGKWQRPLGMQIMENWLQSGMQIDAVASNNDEMAIGAILAIEQAGKLGKILVGGVDATPDALEFMKQGKLNVTVFQDAAGQGKGAIEAAYKVAKGEKIDKTIWIPYELVTPEKCDEYIKKWQK